MQGNKIITVKVIFIGKMLYDEQIADKANIQVDDETTVNHFLQKLNREFSVDASTTLILLNNQDVRCLPLDTKLKNGDTFSVISIIAGG